MTVVSDDLTATYRSGSDGATGGVGDVAVTGSCFGRFVTNGLLGQGGMGIVLSALDPELDRQVAIKVLVPGSPAGSGGDGEAARAQLQREAQAMAKLNHPNVVTVYDVGRAGEHLFIAMELVQGGTLRQWLEAQTRSWREILKMFMEAGRGLEAAHAAGLVHRDFKPENVLLGSDGRPRVSDFGLVTASGALEGGDLEVPLSESSVAVRGVSFGTPAYMSPEQWSGGVIDARGDQFAFCVALWKALMGSHPFAGTTAKELRASVLAGARPAAPSARRVPAWLTQILQRGLENDPSRRWPSMTELLAEIERRAPRRRRVAWSLAVGIAVSAALAAGMLVWLGAARRAPERTGPDVCAETAARTAAVWNPTRAESLRQHTMAIDATDGAARFAVTRDAFEYGARSWIDTRGAVCRLTAPLRRSTDARFAAQVRCLDDWLETATSVLRGLEAATNAGELESAIKGLPRLTPAQRCKTPSVLDAAPPLPTEPAARATASALREELQAINAERKADHFDGLAARADAALAKARELAFPPTLAKALGVRWRVAMNTGDDTGAMGFLRELTEVAARAQDDVETAYAWSIMGGLASRQGKAESAKVMIAAARAACARAGDPPEVKIRLLSDEANVFTTAGDYPSALAALAEARALLDQEGAGQPGSPLVSALAVLLEELGVTYWYAGRPEAALAPLDEALTMFLRAYGPDTVNVGAVQLDRAQILLQLGRYPEAEVAIRESVRIRSERTGDSPSLAVSVSVQAMLAAYQGRAEQALATMDRALEIGRRTMAAEDLEFLAIEADHADVLNLLHHDAEALAVYERLLATVERLGSRNTNVVEWWLGRADLERRMGKCPSALAHAAKASELALALEGKDSHYLGRSLRLEGLCLAQLGTARSTADAIDRLERSMSYSLRPMLQEDAAVARGTLGKLLIETEREAARGKELVEHALADAKAHAWRAPELAALASWYARRR